MNSIFGNTIKKMGYIIGLVIGIPLFILIVNFFFFRGNDASEEIVREYIQSSKKEIIILPKNVNMKYQQYIVGLSRRGRPSAFLNMYPFLDSKFKKHFILLTFDWFDENAQMRGSVIGYNDKGDSISVRINQDQLKNPKYGTKENPIPVFPIDFLNAKWDSDRKYFHVSDDLNKIFVEQYLKHFMPKEEFKETFRK